MKRNLFLLATMFTLVAFTACKGDDDNNEPENTCQTCEIDLLGTPITQEYCDNGDGTITVTFEGQTQTTDLMGATFAEFIAGIEATGGTCN